MEISSDTLMNQTQHNSPAVDRSVNRPVGLSDTPKTDAEEKRIRGDGLVFCVDELAIMSSFARKLESEVAEMRDTLESHGPDGRNVTNGQYVDLMRECDQIRNDLADALNHEYAGELKASIDENARLRDALQKLYTALRDRHYGRMPKEVEEAYNAAADILLPNVEVTGDPLEAACGAGMFVI